MCMFTLYTCKIVYGICMLGEEVPLADYELPLSQAEILQSGMFQSSISHVLIALVYHVHVYTYMTVCVRMSLAL